MKKIFLLCLVIVIVLVSLESHAIQLTDRNINKNKMENYSDEKIINRLLNGLPKGWIYTKKEINYNDPCGLKAVFFIYFSYPAIVYKIKTRIGMIKTNPSLKLTYYPKFNESDWKKYRFGLDTLKNNPQLQYSIDFLFAETDKYTILSSLPMNITVKSKVYEIVQYIKECYKPYLILSEQ